MGSALMPDRSKSSAVSGSSDFPGSTDSPTAKITTLSTCFSWVMVNTTAPLANVRFAPVKSPYSLEKFNVNTPSLSRALNRVVPLGKGEVSSLRFGLDSRACTS